MILSDQAFVLDPQLTPDYILAEDDGESVLIDLPAWEVYYAVSYCLLHADEVPSRE